MSIEVVFRLPGKAPYSYSEVRITGNNVGDLKRDLRDVDADLWTAVGNAFSEALGMTALGELGPRVVPTAPTTGYETPWADASQGSAPDYQPYTPTPTYPPAYEQTAVTQAGSPPGMQTPVCAHGPARYMPAGVSARTGKPYGAFWSCQAPQGQPKCKLPKIQ
ncbi:hypothetical protein SAMN05421505_11272 [Sinosporangium album]|uniref:Uncharacterized protein n=1 Tax=Sinosporangium album TaxID=504805 RepID=A0A1G8ABI0_9ACTN|nr:hypothetical protein [Sinosporangium album]SDH17710.1 hypothetical protein SAMN05421505_11272 [Sinosporangium album]